MRGRRVDLYQSEDYNENNGLKSCIATHLYVHVFSSCSVLLYIVFVN